MPDNFEPMTKEFSDEMHRKDIAAVRDLLYDKYKNNVDAACAANDTVEILMDQFEKMFKRYDEMADDNTTMKEELLERIEALEEEVRNLKDE